MAAGYAIEWRQVSNMIEWSAKEPADRPILKRMVVSALNNKDVASPRTKTVLNHFGFFNHLLGEKFKNLLLLCGNGWTEEHLENIDPGDIQPEIMADIAHRTESGWQELLKCVDAWLKDTSAEQWTTSLDADDNRVEILRQRVADTELEISPARLAEPLVQHFVATLTGDQSIENDFDQIVAALPRNTRSSIPQDFLEHLDGKVVTEEGIEMSLKCYPQTLGRLPLVKAPELALARVLKPLIGSDADEALSFVKRHKADWRKVIKAVPEDQSGVVIELLEGLEQATDEATQHRATAIKDALGIKTKGKEAASRDSDTEA